MITDCLTDLIGIRGECSPVVPSSGLFIDDLVNIDKNKAEKIMDKESNGFAWIKTRINEAGIQVSKEVETHFYSHFRRESIIENDTIGYYRENTPTVAADAAKERGIRIKLDYKDNFSIFIRDITLYITTSGAVSVKIYNVITGKVLDTISIITVADVPTTKIINKTYTSENQILHLAILYEQTMTAYSTNLDFGSCVSCGQYYRNKYIQAFGAEVRTGETKINSNISQKSNTFGMVVNYGLNCDIEPFLCNHMNVLANPIRYKAAAEILRHAKFSTRINSFIFGYNEKIDELVDYYEEQYMGYMYGKFLQGGSAAVPGKQVQKGIIDKLALPNSICWKCDKRINNEVRLPG